MFKLNEVEISILVKWLSQLSNKFCSKKQKIFGSSGFDPKNYRVDDLLEVYSLVIKWYLITSLIRQLSICIPNTGLRIDFVDTAQANLNSIVPAIEQLRKYIPELQKQEDDLN